MNSLPSPLTPPLAQSRGGVFTIALDRADAIIDAAFPYAVFVYAH
jgi:hypothetical protein